jgi:tetratricopeptide (TPR) repeat protein
MADSSRIEELKRRVQVDPASIAFAALAEEYRRAGQFDDAIATCRAGLQRHPAYLSARVTLGRALLEVGQFDEARTELEQVLRAAPENLAAIRGLAEIHHRTGELPEGLEPYRSQPPAGVETALPASEPAAVPAETPGAPVPAPPVVAPRRPIALSTPAGAAAVPVESRPPHPDEAALPALEAWLSAIVRARQELAGGTRSH